MPPNRLHFHGPYPLCSITADTLADCPFRDASGLYIWTVPQLTGGHLITYVGETTTSFYRRMKEHVIQTLGGNYRIIDMDLARQGVERVVWDGLWRQGTRDRLPDLISRHEELAPLIKTYLLGHLVFVAPTDCPARMLRRIEGSLAGYLRSIPAASQLLPVDVRCVVRRRDEQPVRVEVTCDVPVVGLPNKLEA